MSVLKGVSFIEEKLEEVITRWTGLTLNEEPQEEKTQEQEGKESQQPQQPQQQPKDKKEDKEQQPQRGWKDIEKEWGCKEVVYLSPDAEEDLPCISPHTLYCVGGLVDKRRIKVCGIFSFILFLSSFLIPTKKKTESHKK